VEQEAVWGRASQGRWEALGKLAIAAVEVQQMTGTDWEAMGKLAIAAVEVQQMTGTGWEDRRAANRKAYSSWVWLDSRAVHRVNNSILDRAVLSASPF
jgi:hypothetical protein